MVLLKNTAFDINVEIFVSYQTLAMQGQGSVNGWVLCAGRHSVSCSSFSSFV